MFYINPNATLFSPWGQMSSLQSGSSSGSRCYRWQASTLRWRSIPSQRWISQTNATRLWHTTWMLVQMPTLGPSCLVFHRDLPPPPPLSSLPARLPPAIPNFDLCYLSLILWGEAAAGIEGDGVNIRGWHFSVIWHHRRQVSVLTVQVASGPELLGSDLEGGGRTFRKITFFCYD